jgi:hypothetical protein
MEHAMPGSIGLGCRMFMEVEREPLSVNAELADRGEGFGEFHCKCLICLKLKAARAQ